MNDSKNIRLFIDTATKSFALGARVDGKKRTRDLGNPKQVLELTHEGIKSLGEKRGFTLSEVREYYCLLGPGSNTGIRLGLTIPRTVYAIDPTIKIFGIGTRDFLLTAGNCAVLSDRNGNLFYKDKERKESHIRIRKEEIPSFAYQEPIVVEESDKAAIEALKEHRLVLASVISLRREDRKGFTDFSSKEEEFLPEYARKI